MTTYTWSRRTVVTWQPGRLVAHRPPEAPRTIAVPAPLRWAVAALESGLSVNDDLRERHRDRPFFALVERLERAGLVVPRQDARPLAARTVMLSGPDPFIALIAGLVELAGAAPVAWGAGPADLLVVAAEHRTDPATVDAARRMPVTVWTVTLLASGALLHAPFRGDRGPCPSCAEWRLGTAAAAEGYGVWAMRGSSGSLPGDIVAAAHLLPRLADPAATVWTVDAATGGRVVRRHPGSDARCVLCPTGATA